MFDMSEKEVNRRAELLKFMDDYLRKNVQDEEVFMTWLSLGVPDGANENDYLDIAESEEMFNDCTRIFAVILKADMEG